jgi:chromosome segregation ATPase
MIRIFIALLLSFTIALSEEDINKKIKATSSKIDKFSKNYSTLNKKLASTAKAILNKKLEIEKQQKLLKELKRQLGNKELSYKENKTQLKELKVQNEELKNEQDTIEQELVFVIAQSVTLSVILEDDYAVDEKSLIEFEILKNMLKSSKEKAKQLNDRYYANSKDINSLNERAENLKNSIATIDNKRKKLLNVQKTNKKSLKELELAKSSYKKKVKALIRKQNLLKNTLAKLNIIKVDEEKKAREAQEQKKGFCR